MLKWSYKLNLLFMVGYFSNFCLNMALTTHGGGHDLFILNKYVVKIECVAYLVST